MAYIGVSPSNGVRQKHTYTATASQTTFSGAGSEGVSLSYRDSNYVDVYVNGVKLGDADYTATSGTSIVLGVGAAVNDIVEIMAYDVFSVADTVSKADGGTFDGNVTMAGTLGVTGETTLATHLNMGDNDIIKLGDSADLQIYHDGASGASYIAETGASNLILLGTNFRVNNAANTQSMIVADDNSFVKLHYAGAGKLETTSSGIDVTGTVTASAINVAGASGAEITITDNSPSTVSLYMGAGNSSVSIGSTTSDPVTFLTANTERMRIDSSGNVGIGTSSPVASSLLTLKETNAGGDGAELRLINSSTTVDTATQIVFTNTTTDTADSAVIKAVRTASGQDFRFSSDGTERMRIDSAGHVTMPYQSAFNAYLSTNQINFALNTHVTVLFDLERFDNNGDFNTSTYTFTAPVTGKYQFNLTIRFNEIDTAAGFYQANLQTSNRTYSIYTIDPEYSSDPLYLHGNWAILTDMDAGDTAYVSVYQNNGTAQTDISSGADSNFTGFLVC